MKQKKIMAMIIAASMVLGSSGTVFAAPTFPDMPNDWSTSALQNAIDKGLLSGMDGKLMPKANLTRAQMASIMNRAFGNTEKASLSGYTDVPASAWYYDDMAKAVAAGIFVGSDGKLNPNSNITREEAFAVMARAYKLDNGSASDLAKFSDANMVSSWAVGNVAGLVNAGWVSGSDGKLNPKSYITRAEFAVILDKAGDGDAVETADTVIDKAGTYTEVAEGNVKITVTGVTLKDLTITGDLILGEGIGKGDVTLDGVTVKGDTLVQGGGENSVKLTDSKFSGAFTIDSEVGTVRIVTKGTTIDDAVVKTGAILEGNFGTVTVTAGSVEVRGNVKKMTIEKKVTLTVASGKIDTLNVLEGAGNSDIKVTKNGAVTTITVEADGTKISGEGSVNRVNANADDVIVNTSGTRVVAGEGTTGVKAGNTPIEAGKETTTSGGSGGGGGGGGSSSAKSYTVAVYRVFDDTVTTELAYTGKVTSGSTFNKNKVPATYKDTLGDGATYTLIGIFTNSACTEAYTDGRISENTTLYAKYTKGEVVPVSNITEPGRYTQVQLAKGDITVSVPGVTIFNATISGNLTIAEGVGEGDVTLDNVVIQGETIVAGGGESSIHFNSVTANGGVRITKNGGVRIVTTGKEIANVILEGVKAILSGDFKNVSVEGNNKPALQIVSGKVGSISVKAPEAQISAYAVAGDTVEIQSIAVDKAATGTDVKAGDGASVNKVSTAAENTSLEVVGSVANVVVEESATGATINSTGTLTNVEVNAGGVSVDTSNGTTVKVGADVPADQAPTVNDKVVEPGKTETVTAVSIKIVPVVEGKEGAAENYSLAAGKDLTYKPTINGYEAGGYFTDADCTKAWDGTATEGMTIYVEYTKVVKVFTVTFDVDGGTPTVDAAKVEEGKTVAKPATDPTKAGYKFLGWYLNGAAYDFSKAVTGDITLVATWEKEEAPTPSEKGQLTLTLGDLGASGTATIDCNYTVNADSSRVYSVAADTVLFTATVGGIKDGDTITVAQAADFVATSASNKTVTVTFDAATKVFTVKLAKDATFVPDEVLTFTISGSNMSTPDNYTTGDVTKTVTLKVGKATKISTQP